jgi:hypothetical protein
LTPLAIGGLSSDTLRRRFRPDEHPRLHILLNARGPSRLDPGRPPYDGLLIMYELFRTLKKLNAEGLTIIVVEQNALLALQWRDMLSSWISCRK